MTEPMRAIRDTGETGVDVTWPVCGRTSVFVPGQVEALQAMKNCLPA